MGLNDISTKIITLSVCAVMVVAFAVPVIASLNGGGGGGETVTYRNDGGTFNSYFITLDENSSYTVEVGDVNPEYDWPDLNVTDLNTGAVHYVAEPNDVIWGNNLNERIFVVGNQGTYFFRYSDWAQSSEGTGVIVSGTSATFQGEETAVMQDAMMLGYDESGSYVLSYTDEWTYMPYLNEDSIVYMWIQPNDDPYGYHDIIIKGSSKANTVVIDDAESDSAEFILEDNRLVGVTVTLDGQPTSIRFDEQYDYMGNLEIFAPIEVTIGSGSGSSGLDGTLGTLVSVIPLLMVVGLVTVAVAMFVRKD